MGKPNPKHKKPKEVRQKKETYNFNPENAMQLLHANLNSGMWVFIAGDLNACLSSGWTDRFGKSCPENYMGAFENKDGKMPFMMLKKTPKLAKILNIDIEQLRHLVAIEFGPTAEYRMAYWDDNLPLKKIIEVILSSFVEEDENEENQSD